MRLDAAFDAAEALICAQIWFLVEVLTLCGRPSGLQRLIIGALGVVRDDGHPEQVGVAWCLPG